jgi:hypothetical protein
MAVEVCFRCEELVLDGMGRTNRGWLEMMLLAQQMYSRKVAARGIGLEEDILRVQM